MKFHTDKQVAGLRDHQFKPGESGNSQGRPPGARNRLSTRVLNDLLEAWEAGGKEAIARLMKRQPGLVLRAVVQIMPKEITHRTEGALTNMSNEALDAFIEHTKREIAARSIRSSATREAEAPSADKLN
jgi:hypothetical protein